MDDVVLLSRLQFAFTIAFHYLFPPLTIGLGVILVYLDFRWLRTDDPIYEQAAKFWTRIFALNFAIGVASGIVMEFEFGTNWATYSRFVGDVFGSALAAEGIFAFFLESGFLAVLVFGWNRVSKGLHFFATCMVALGSCFSSIWIVIANSWQQTPAGHRIVDMTRDGKPWIVDGEVLRRAEIVDFWAMVQNPSSLERLLHVWLGCLIVGGALVLSVSGYYLLRRRHEEFARRSLQGGLVMFTTACLLIGISGHSQAGKVAINQPAKLAALEGHYETGPGDLTLFGWPDDEAQELRYAVSVPGGLSFLIHGDFQTPVPGLDKFRREDQPKVAIPFFSYHLMVGCGSGLLALGLLGCFFLFRGRDYPRWLLVGFMLSIVPAIAANHAGWIAAETGRQPWIVHPPIPRTASGELELGPQGTVVYDETLALRTTAGVSKTVAAEQVLSSLILFGFVYGLLFLVWIYVLNEKIQHGPDPLQEPGDPPPSGGLFDAAKPGGALLAGAPHAGGEGGEELTAKDAKDAKERQGPSSPDAEEGDAVEENSLSLSERDELPTAPGRTGGDREAKPLANLASLAVEETPPTTPSDPPPAEPAPPEPAPPQDPT